jgi:hypothetical protein
LVDIDCQIKACRFWLSFIWDILPKYFSNFTDISKLKIEGFRHSGIEKTLPKIKLDGYPQLPSIINNRLSPPVRGIEGGDKK